MSLKGKTIILGVTGSVAAYKAAEICSQLVKLEADVHCVMTESATHLIGPITLQTLSRNPVGVNIWDEGKGWKPGHIELADRADLLLVAPATAHTIACFAQGLCPNLLTSIYLATPAPVMIAPAMNGKMYRHPATQVNLKTLIKRGNHMLPPQKDGILACGYEGEGKLAVVEDVVKAVAEVF